VILNRLAVALCVFNLGMLPPFQALLRLSQLLASGLRSWLVPPPPSLLAAQAITLTPLRLAERDAPFLTVGQKEAPFPYVTQHLLPLYFFAKALE
jgi:hypothetical protein